MNRRPRAPFIAKTLVLLALVSTGIVALTRVLTRQVERSVARPQLERHTTGLGLAVAAWERIPRAIQHGGPKIYVIGSSVSMDLRIEPTAYANFNFGFFAAGPALLDWFSRKIAVADASRPAVIALEFLPHFYTMVATRSLEDSTALRKAALLDRETVGWLLAESWRDIRSVALSWLRGVSAPEIVVNILNERLVPPKASPRPSSSEDFQRQNRLYDLADLDVNQLSIDTFIEIALRLSDRTTCMVVFIPPENQQTWQRTELGERNLEAMLSKIESATGRKVVRSSQPYTADLFRDATHLNRREGQQQFNEDLASVVAQECPKRLK